MSPQSRLVSDTELEILKVLWDLEEGTVRDILQPLNEDGRNWAYTTAQTLLNRLQEKGFVTSTKRGRAFCFRPAISREDLLGQSLDSLANRVCDGAKLPLLLSLVQRAKYSAKDIRRFRDLLDELEEQD